MEKWLLLILIISPVSGEDGIDALRALLKAHKPVPAATTTIVGSKFTTDRGIPAKLIERKVEQPK